MARFSVPLINTNSAALYHYNPPIPIPTTTETKTKPDPVIKQAEMANAPQDVSAALKDVAAKTKLMLSKISDGRRESDLPTEDKKNEPPKGEIPVEFKTEKEKKDEDKKVGEDTKVKPEDVARG